MPCYSTPVTTFGGQIRQPLLTTIFDAQLSAITSNGKSGNHLQRPPPTTNSSNHRLLPTQQHLITTIDAKLWQPSMVAIHSTNSDNHYFKL